MKAGEAHATLVCDLLPRAQSRLEGLQLDPKVLIAPAAGLEHRAAGLLREIRAMRGEA